MEGVEIFLYGPLVQMEKDLVPTELSWETTDI